ncbi:MAG: Rpn family recombination-promoting nuclease/putative transposase [Fibrobacter sp.]|nr:Rpn family recombination-promoting nuclease/putative transposase [Fibrobacter sp.]
METNHIPFEELPITNRFMFALVFSHKHIAKPFLEALLGINIFDLQEPEPEKSTENSPFTKGVRYDVFVKERGPKGECIRAFDIEIQMEYTHELPKRTRYYQALCDSEALNKGESYRNLKEQYIIFICPDDIFKQGRAVYRFKNLEIGHPEHDLGDLCFKNFYIFNAYRDVAEKSIKEYLEYFATNRATSQETKNIERQRQWYLSDNETRKRYMTWQQELDDMVYEERERAKAAEKRANEEKCRADEALNLASKEKSRADKYEKILKEHGLL